MSIILKYLITFFVGMVPILELRGAIPIGVGLGLSYFEAFICSFIGNIIPIYFIVKYIRPLFDFFGRCKPFKVIIDWATERATRKIEESEKLQKTKEENEKLKKDLSSRSNSLHNAMEIIEKLTKAGINKENEKIKYLNEKNQELFDLDKKNKEEIKNLYEKIVILQNENRSLKKNLKSNN